MSQQQRGVFTRGIRTPIIRPGDDLARIVLGSVSKEIPREEMQDKDIIAVTEAVLAISQNNFATAKDIQSSIQKLYGDVDEIAIVDPIQSRNRFLAVLKSICETPTLKKVWIFLTHPFDEVGNSLIESRSIINHFGILDQEPLSTSEFVEKYGTPCHKFTGKNYLEEYSKAGKGKVEIILCNDFSFVPKYCKNALIASIHRKDAVRQILLNSGIEKVFDLSDIMREPVGDSGYNSQCGLYGSNLQDKNILKLMPRNSQEWVEQLQKEAKERFGITPEIMVYGDGCFRDPVGGIWELADPVSTLGATSGLLGTPEEVKLKYIASQYPLASEEEIQEILLKELNRRKLSQQISESSSLGTTPRRITDLIASLSDLNSGSGNRQTPVVYIQNYL